MAPMTAYRPPTDRTTNELLSCPNEVIQTIVEATASAQEKLALCLVNKRLYRQSQPYIYTYIDLTRRHTRRCPPMILLIGTLLRRPDLALAVRHLLLSSYCGSGFLSSDLSPSTCDLLDKKLGSHWETVHQQIRPPPPLNPIARPRPLSQEHLWSPETKNWKTDAFAGLLLLLVPRLSHLTLAFNFSMQAPSIVGRVIQDSTTLTELEHVSVGSATSLANKAGDDNFKVVFALLKLPKLKTITTSFRHPEISSWSLGPSHIFHATTTITTLSLGGITDEIQLQLLLKLTPGLKVLRWTPDDGGLEQQIMRLSVIADALQYVAGTLTKLTIDTNPYHRPLCSGSWGGLWAKMHHLEELTIPANLLQLRLFQQYYLPTSLRHLTLMDGESVIRERCLDKRLTKLTAKYHRTGDGSRFLLACELLCLEQAGYAAASIWMRNWKTRAPNLRSIELVTAIRTNNHHSVAQGGLLLKQGETADLEVRVSERGPESTRDADSHAYLLAVRAFRDKLKQAEGYRPVTAVSRRNFRT